MKEKRHMLIIVLILVLLSLAMGFFIGRSTVRTDYSTIVKYQKGEEIVDSIRYPVPIDVIRPVDTANIIMQCVKDGIYAELFPEKTVFEYIEVTREDTNRILEDWATKRIYSEKLFDIDTVGTFSIEATVQYNRISLLEYSYIPVTKVVSNNSIMVRTFSPFIGGGLVCIPSSESLMLGVSFDGGIFIKEKYGIKVQYGHMFDVNRYNLYGLSFVYKF